MSLDFWNKTGILYREISLYKQLMNKKVKITFLTYGDKKELKYSNLLNGIKIISVLEFIYSKNNRIYFLKSLLLPFKLRREFKNFNIIKTNQLEGSWITWLAKILYRKKLIVRGGFEWLKFYILENASKKRKFIKYWLKYFWIYLIELISYKLADRIILTSELDIEFIIKTFKLRKKKKKIQLFYNFIDIDLFKPYNMKKKDKHVLFIGRFNYQKNLFNLLKAFKDLEGFTLDLIGDGEDYYKKELIEKAGYYSIKLNLLGTFPNNQLPEIINQYQIFILPSFYEGNPKVLLEAMSCGIPCIGTNVIGIKNLIKHKENGYLCETSSDSLRKAIMTLYNDGELRKKIGLKAREFVLNNCSINKIIDKEYNLYKSLFQ